MTKFLSRKRVAERRGTSVSTEKRLQKTDPRYPHPVQISPGRVAFVEDEVDAYNAALIAERDKQREAT